MSDKFVANVSSLRLIIIICIINVIITYLKEIFRNRMFRNNISVKTKN